MILRKEIGFDIRNLVSTVPVERNSFDECPGGVADLHRMFLDLAILLAARHVQAELVMVHAESVDRREAEGGKTALPDRGALLVGVVAPEVDKGSQNQRIVARAPYAHVEAGYGQRVFEQRLPQRQAVCQRTGIVVD